MNFRKPSRRQMLLSCAEVREDDGLNARDFFRRGDSRSKSDRKTMQLCAQVADTLNGALAASSDERLQMLQVIAVVPAPNAGQLLVTVVQVAMPSAADVWFTVEATRAALAGASGWLRSEVAAAITRKQAPRLLFEVALGEQPEAAPGRGQS